MLETVEMGLRNLTKQEYKPIYTDLTTRLITLQQEAHKAGKGLVVLFEGWNGAGKGSRISDILYNLDARSTSVHFTPDLDTLRARDFYEKHRGVSGYYPFMQEFWNALGPRGNVTFYDRGWYTSALQHLFYIEFGQEAESLTKENLKRGWRSEAIKRYIESLEAFERQLTDDGYVVVKFFLHVSAEVQKKRLLKLYEDPATRWRVSKAKLKSTENYSQAYKFYDRLLEESDYDFAPWVLVNGEDKRRANLEIAATLAGAFEAALSRTQDAETKQAAVRAAQNSAGALSEDAPKISSSQEDYTAWSASVEQARVDSLHAPRASRFETVPGPALRERGSKPTLGEGEYRRRLKLEQKRFAVLEQEMYLARIPLLIMYEGWDAAGKGGNIKRVAQALDARAYTIFPSTAPTKPELLHPPLWRYWTRLPKAGHVGIYDRSWYGRVLVERVEGFASPTQWARAYDEINEFEYDLHKWGAILIKFWVDVSREEQLARFEEREADPAKQWKITEEDWRNRDRYPQYETAVEDMFRLTSIAYAPWTVLESDDKRFARVKALEIINHTLNGRLHEK